MYVKSEHSHSKSGELKVKVVKCETITVSLLHD